MAGAVLASISDCNVLTNPTVKTCFPKVTASNTRALLSVNAGALNERNLIIKAAMRITGGTTTAFTPTITWNSGSNTDLTTFTNDVDFSTISGVSVNSVTRNWFFIIELYHMEYRTTAAARIAHQMDVTFSPYSSSMPFSTITLANFNFFCTGLFSVSNANNLAVLTQFEISQD